MSENNCFRHSNIHEHTIQNDLSPDYAENDDGRSNSDNEDGCLRGPEFNADGTVTQQVEVVFNGQDTGLLATEISFDPSDPNNDPLQAVREAKAAEKAADDNEALKALCYNLLGKCGLSATLKAQLEEMGVTEAEMAQRTRTIDVGAEITRLTAEGSSSAPTPAPSPPLTFFPQQKAFSPPIPSEGNNIFVFNEFEQGEGNQHLGWLGPPPNGATFNEEARFYMQQMPVFLSGLGENGSSDLFGPIGWGFSPMRQSPNGKDHIHFAAVKASSQMQAIWKAGLQAKFDSPYPGLCFELHQRLESQDKQIQIQKNHADDLTTKVKQAREGERKANEQAERQRENADAYQRERDQIDDAYLQLQDTAGDLEAANVYLESQKDKKAAQQEKDDEAYEDLHDVIANDNSSERTGYTAASKKPRTAYTKEGNLFKKWVENSCQVPFCTSGSGKYACPQCGYKMCGLCCTVMHEPHNLIDGSPTQQLYERSTINIANLETDCETIEQVLQLQAAQTAHNAAYGHRTCPACRHELPQGQRWERLPMTEVFKEAPGAEYQRCSVQ